jgi:hypothetical protein
LGPAAIVLLLHVLTGDFTLLTGTTNLELWQWQERDGEAAPAAGGAGSRGSSPVYRRK